MPPGRASTCRCTAPASSPTTSRSTPTGWNNGSAVSTASVGAGWEAAATGSYEADLEFLSRVADKVAREREDLGRVNPVLSSAVEARMLGKPLLRDPFTAQPGTATLRAEQDLREQVMRLRRQ